MTHGSLFSGLGGFDISAEWMGWDNIFYCEIENYCQQLLKKRFPYAKGHSDIKTTDFTIYRGRIDVLSGGDPCQPHSVAGLGKGQNDDRFLWPEMYRAIREIRPYAVVNENVIGSVSNGVLDLKITDLEREGYTCQAIIIPAEAVGALHQRERVWLIAFNADRYAHNRASGQIQGTGNPQRLQKRNSIQLPCESVDLWPEYSDPYRERFEEQYFSEKPDLRPERLSGHFGFSPYAYGNIPKHIIESGIIRMLNGLPTGMDYADRNKRLKALGNAVVPEVVYEIFKAIEQSTL